ncbi:MAG TPA: hypothetical protein VIY48_06340 [Candidatus Paceibacterota bacterium]
MAGEKRDLVIHYDEDNQKIIFYSTDISNTESIRAKEFDGVCPEVEFFKTQPPDIAEQRLGAMVFSLLDLHSTRKVGIRNYAAEADEAMNLLVQELEEEVKHNDPDAQYHLFIRLHSLAMKNYSLSELERAESLLLASAAQGHPEATSSLESWPDLKAAAERRIKRGKP